MNNANVAHAWAHQTRCEATGSNMFFDGPTIYSYGRHYPIAKRVSDNLYLLNIRGYSITTAKHTCHVRSAIPYGAVIISVPDLSKGYEANMEAYCREIEDTTIKLVRSRKRAGYYLIEISKLLAKAKAYEEYIRPRVKNKAFAKLARKWAGDNSKLLVSAKIQADKQREAAKRAKAEKDKRIAATYAKKCKAFAAYEINDFVIPGQFDRVRLSVDKQNIETSKHIVIPISEAKRFADSGLLHKVGRWAVNKRDAKTITIGCHKFEIAHLLNIAKTL